MPLPPISSTVNATPKEYCRFGQGLLSPTHHHRLFFAHLTESRIERTVSFTRFSYSFMFCRTAANESPSSQQLENSSDTAPPHAVDSRGNALGVRKGPSTPYSMCTARTFLSYSIRISWQNSCFIAATSDLYFSFSDSTDMSCLFNVYTDHSDREGFTRICWDSVSDREIGVTCSLSSVG